MRSSLLHYYMLFPYLEDAPVACEELAERLEPIRNLVGVHRPSHLIFTLFQSNTYKVNVREFLPRDLCRENGQSLAL